MKVLENWGRKIGDLTFTLFYIVLYLINMSFISHKKHVPSLRNTLNY